MGVQGLGFRVRGSGFKAQGSAFEVQGFGLRVHGFGFRVQDLGNRVQALEIRKLGSGARFRFEGFRVRSFTSQDSWSIYTNFLNPEMINSMRSFVRSKPKP